MPAVCDTRHVLLNVPGAEYRMNLSLWDTCDRDEYDHLRPLTYPDTHVVLIAFSIASPESLERVQEKVSIHLFCKLSQCKKRDVDSIHGLRSGSPKYSIFALHGPRDTFLLARRRIYARTRIRFETLLSRARSRYQSSR
jgi:hypothetical protein